MDMKNARIIDLVVTYATVLVSLSITIISGFKVNGLESVWLYTMPFSSTICLLFSFRGTILISEIQQINNINSMLRNLNYSDNEIDERQNYLRSLSDTELEKLASKLKEKEFLKPLENML